MGDRRRNRRRKAGTVTYTLTPALTPTLTPAEESTRFRAGLHYHSPTLLFVLLNRVVLRRASRPSPRRPSGASRRGWSQRADPRSGGLQRGGNRAKLESNIT
ncbi:hypothetical protein ACTMU2_19070 [Cupriavidus basilensis]